MKILVAPDKLKGSAGASAAAARLCAGLRRGAPGAELLAMPLADGGEGSLDALLPDGPRRSLRASGPDGASRAVEWGLTADGQAILETARVIGAAAAAPGTDRGRTAHTSSYGVGQLIEAALSAGAREIIIGLGGSTTTDGGAGMLQALGVRFAGAPVPITGAHLQGIEAVDLAGLDARVAAVRIVCACDVENPLLGSDGAAAVYAPQKGAGADDVRELEAGLEHYAALLAPNLTAVPRTGAAGGIGFGARAALGASLVSGADLVLDAVGFDAALDGADWVITAEGRLDAQTLSGKLVAKVAERAGRHGVPVLAVAGSIELSPAELRKLGVLAAFSLCPGPLDVPTALRRGPELLERIGEQLGAVLATRGRKTQPSSGSGT